MEPNEAEKILYGKEYHNLGKVKAYRVEKGLYQLYI